MDKKEIAEYLKQIDDEIKLEEQALFSDQQLVNMGPKFYGIIDILKQNPLLIAPTLKWLHVTQSRLAQAQLNILYTPEELEEMKTKIK